VIPVLVCGTIFVTKPSETAVLLMVPLVVTVKVSVVLVTLVSVQLPLTSACTPMTLIASPAKNPCAALVVRTAVVVVFATLETTAALSKPV